jgi:hypothetical protein
MATDQRMFLSFLIGYLYLDIHTIDHGEHLHSLQAR